MAKWKALLKSCPLIRVLSMPYRLWTALSYYWPVLAGIPGWVLRSKEHSNFTYDVTESSKQCLADVVAIATGSDSNTVLGYLAEFDTEFEKLNAHCHEVLSASDDRYVSDAGAKPGRRLAYYALVRALKPRVVVEAGAARGLGTCIMDIALQRNAGEGFPGIVYAVDVEPKAGCLIREPYQSCVKLSISDAEPFLKRFQAPVDLFIYDIVNAAEVERRQYAAIEAKLESDCVVVAVWTTGALREFAARTGRQHLTFRDEPLDHWHPGCKIAIAYRAGFPRNYPSEAREAGQTQQFIHQ